MVKITRAPVGLHLGCATAVLQASSLKEKNPEVDKKSKEGFPRHKDTIAALVYPALLLAAIFMHWTTFRRVSWLSPVVDK